MRSRCVAQRTDTMAGVRRLRVMLVEDNDFTRSTVASSLREEDCDVVAAVATARDAMLAAESHDIDCAVIDLHLGQGPSGIDVPMGFVNAIQTWASCC